MNKILTFNWSVMLSSWFVKNGFPLMAKELCVVRYAYLLKGKELFCECFLKEKKNPLSHNKLLIFESKKFYNMV